jgi:hypothetical protein
MCTENRLQGKSRELHCYRVFDQHRTSLLILVPLGHCSLKVKSQLGSEFFKMKYANTSMLTTLIMEDPRASRSHAPQARDLSEGQPLLFFFVFMKLSTRVLKIQHMTRMPHVDVNFERNGPRVCFLKFHKQPCVCDRVRLCR